jgi:hypothetical protein
LALQIGIGARDKTLGRGFAVVLFGGGSRYTAYGFAGHGGGLGFGHERSPEVTPHIAARSTFSKQVRPAVLFSEKLATQQPFTCLVTHALILSCGGKHASRQTRPGSDSPVSQGAVAAQMAAYGNDFFMFLEPSLRDSTNRLLVPTPD